MADVAELATTVRTLIRDEHEGARHLRHLARQEAGARGGLYALLLETIARDSEKHATIFQFILRQIETAPHSEPLPTESTSSMLERRVPRHNGHG
jgi:hypothetical protein